MAIRGGKHPLEYLSWYAAKHRCSSPANKSYSYYGGRGIRMCERWERSFATFLGDMGARPTPKHTLDRIDVDGDYEPSNCRWVTRTVQQQNRRMTIPIELGGT